jgi:hypothetical protein
VEVARRLIYRNRLLCWKNAPALLCRGSLMLRILNRISDLTFVSSHRCQRRWYSMGRLDLAFLL